MKNRDEVTIKDALKHMVNKYKLGDKVDESKLKLAWTEVMGDIIQKYTQEVGFKKGTLYISLTSSPLKQELTLAKSKIIANMNKEMGKELITQIIFK